MRWPGRDRTCDLLNQNQAFFQLNYWPFACHVICRAPQPDADSGLRFFELQVSSRGHHGARPLSHQPVATHKVAESVERLTDRCSVSSHMGSLVKKRRKRMRKKKHRKMLKRTRAQRQRGK